MKRRYLYIPIICAVFFGMINTFSVDYQRSQMTDKEIAAREQPVVEQPVQQKAKVVERGYFWKQYNSKAITHTEYIQAQLDLQAIKKFLLEDKNNPDNIILILEFIQAQDLEDKNDDGVINCIDYAKRFRELYGNQARLMVNYNPDTGMNHMYIKIKLPNNKYIEIEPQAGSDKGYTMQEFWGNVFDPAYSRDATWEY